VEEAGGRGYIEEYVLTCRTFKARRISPFDNLNNAALPSSVILHLSSAITLTSLILAIFRRRKQKKGSVGYSKKVKKDL